MEVRSQEGETHGAEETSGEAGKTRDEKREKEVESHWEANETLVRISIM